MNYKIRKSTIVDADQLFSLVESFSTSFIPEKSAFFNSFQNLLNDDSVLVNVVEFGNFIIGYCLAFDHYAFYANGRVTWVEEIMVSSNYRRKGIGRDLMNSVEKWASERNSKLIGLATRRADSFYKSIGYEESAIFFKKQINS